MDILATLGSIAARVRAVVTIIITAAKVDLAQLEAAGADFAKAWDELTAAAANLSAAAPAPTAAPASDPAVDPVQHDPALATAA